DLGWNGAPAANAWHHLVYTQSGTDTKVYADGVLKNEEVVGISSHADNPIRIGAQNESQGGGNATQQYSGSIAQIRIHAGVLSPEDILANYDAGIEASSSGGDPDLSKTTIVAAADSTLAVATEPGQPVVLGDVEVADGVALSIGDAVNVEITNLTLGAGSIAKSSLAAPVTGTSDATITIKGRFTGGDNSAIGDTGDEFGIGSDWYFTNLTLAGTSTFEWTFTSGALDVDLDFDGEDDLAAGDSLEVFGAVNLEDGVKIQLVAGGGSSAAGGVDVALFWAIDGATWDPSKVTVKPPPDHLDWTWETDGLGYPVLEYVNDEWVVLKGLVAPGDTPESHPGDANGDDRVNEVDLAILNDQWGLRAPDQSCDFDGDGDVDIDDFNILKVNMGWDGTGGGAPQATASETPEPCSAVLMLLGLGAVIRRRRKCQDR
ncbi:MAG: PEP-CTERM sorting domain-containing protein, partial [Phycisphaerae bacterium]|nr:PEP-CTERM sorting domain-containing protein [Phycisphaerae bacterium]